MMTCSTGSAYDCSRWPRELGNVRAACRQLGVHHSTYYRWRRQLERWGLEALRPRAPEEIRTAMFWTSYEKAQDQWLARKARRDEREV
jgi:transposase-like protein